MLGSILLIGVSLAAVPESTLGALDGRVVTLTLSDGREATGTIEDVSAGNVVLITSAGEVLTTPSAKVSEVRVVSGAAQSSAPQSSAPKSTAKLSTPSQGKVNDIGLHEVPPRPASKSCTWTWSEGRSQSLRVRELPQALVPWDYDSGKVFKSTRFYDEQGKVYRYNEAANLIWSSDCCDEQKERYDMYRRRAIAWSIPATGFILLSAPVGGVLGWPFLVPEMIASMHQKQQVEDAVYEYNVAQGY